MLNNFKRDLHKFLLLTLWVGGIILYGTYKLGIEINHMNLYNESMLKLQGRNTNLMGRPFRASKISNALSETSTKLSPSSAGSDRRTALAPYIPPESPITITPKDKTKTLDQVVNVRYNVCGLTFRPGLVLDGIPLGLGLDSKLVYCGHFGAEAGVMKFKGMTTTPANPTLGLSYRLDTLSHGWLSNTEAEVQYSPIPYPVVAGGLRINL